MLRSWKRSRRLGMCGREGFLGIGNGQSLDGLNRDRIARYVEYVRRSRKYRRYDLSVDL